MSILCARIPDFLLTVAARPASDLRARPIAWLDAAQDPSGRVVALSPPARRDGVRAGMTPQQARARSPHIDLLPLDLVPVTAAHDAFLHELAVWQLPLESPAFGLAYLDLHAVATVRHAVQPLAADLGNRLRRVLGPDLTPALGWDHSLFTARAAAHRARPGCMTLVDAADQVRFLAPLPVDLLPLPPLDLQRLAWLGIDTLGAFASLPAAAVLQQFGSAGRLAHRWAKGQDNRPLRPTPSSAWAPLDLDLDPPAAYLAPALDLLLAALAPHLETWTAQLTGLTRLHLELLFADRAVQLLELAWVEPVATPFRLRTHLAHQLAARPWPAPLDRIRVTHAATAELPAQQLTLFTDPPPAAVSLDQLLAPLRRRYGPVFHRGHIADPRHPVDERRACWQ